MFEIAYTSETTDPIAEARQAWDALDARVLNVIGRPGEHTLARVATGVATGISAHTVRTSLRVLIGDGLVDRVERLVVVEPRGPVVQLETQVVYRLTAAGRERLAARTAAISQAA